MIDQHARRSSSWKSTAIRSRKFGKRSKRWSVRPAIGVAAAYGARVGMQTVAGATMRPLPAGRRRQLASSRPTAVNLSGPWNDERAALERRGQKPPKSPKISWPKRAIHEEDRAMCRAIGHHGAELLSDGQAS